MLGILDRGSEEEDRMEILVRGEDIEKDGEVFLIEGEIEIIVIVDEMERKIGRNLKKLEEVNIEELLRLG